MIGLLILILICIMIFSEAKGKRINPLPYIVGAIALGIVPGFLVRLFSIDSEGILIAVNLLSFGLCVIPYYLVREADMGPEDDFL